MLCDVCQTKLPFFQSISRNTRCKDCTARCNSAIKYGVEKIDPPVKLGNYFSVEQLLKVMSL